MKKDNKNFKITPNNVRPLLKEMVRSDIDSTLTKAFVFCVPNQKKITRKTINSYSFGVLMRL
tara:strand:- start:66 stop:251 length:186 start_codon:yes stop_codon:yes gene_type:complete